MIMNFITFLDTTTRISITIVSIEYHVKKKSREKKNWKQRVKEIFH